MGNNINVILGSKGECCLCSNTPHCGDCGEEEPPPKVCDCNVCGMFNMPSACDDKAEVLYGACGKCVNAGPCEIVCGGGVVGTQGCYDPEPVNCLDLGCFDCEPAPEPPEDPCIKIVDDVCACEDIELTCCSYADKTCTDFSFLYFSDKAQAGLLCGALDCYKSAPVECETLECFQCKTCEDFGYTSDSELDCEPGLIAVPVSPCGAALVCYHCVSANCDCADHGYYNTCKEAKDSLGNCGECETQSPYPVGSDCEGVVCYNPFCQFCGFNGDSTCASVESTCPKTKCFVVNVTEDWDSCDAPCNTTAPCCICDYAPCSTLAPCGDIEYVDDPKDCPIPLVGKMVTTSCDKVWHEGLNNNDCHRCCLEECPVDGEYCDILTAGCGVQMAAGSSTTKFFAFDGPVCEAVTLKLTYKMGFTPDACSLSTVIACGALVSLGTTGCSKGGSINLAVPKEAISLNAVCTYNCSGLDSNNDGKLNSSSIDGFSLSCIP